MSASVPAAAPPVRAPDEMLGWLQSQSAQGDLISWARARGVSWPEFWYACPRGDWLLAIAQRAGVPSAALRRAAIAAAGELLLDIDDPTLDDALRRLDAVHDALAAPEDVRAAVEHGSRHAHDMAHALAWSTVSLLLDSYEDVSAVAMVPVQIAETVLATVMDCGMAAAMGASLARSADRIRAALPCPTLPE